MILQKLWRQYAPPWLLDGPNIGTFYEAQGSLLDSLSQRVLDGRLAAIPWAGPGIGVEEPLTSTGQRIEAQPDALPFHSLDRGIKIYASMGLLAQRQNIAKFRQLHAQRGTHWGEILHVRAYFADAVAAGYAYPRITIVFQDNEGTPVAIWYSIAPDGTRTLLRVSPSNFNYDGRNSDRTRWWAFLDMTGTGYTLPALWGSFSWGDGTLWGQGGLRPFTAQAQQDIAAMFNDWHSAHSWLAGVVAVWPGVGGAAFPSAAGTPTQDASGWWSLPNGAGTWQDIVLPAPDGRASRPPNFQWVYEAAPIFV